MERSLCLALSSSREGEVSGVMAEGWPPWFRLSRSWAPSLKLSSQGGGLHQEAEGHERKVQPPV